MKFSIIVPCFNAELTIAETLDSIFYHQNISQDLLEVIVVDGGSTDRTNEIIRLYSDQLKLHIIEPDDGQYDAINKGIDHATGDIISYLNADDMYLPGTLLHVANLFESHPQVPFIYGDTINLLSDGSWIAKPKTSFSFKIALHAYLIVNQPSSFWRSSVHSNIGQFDISLDCCADYDFILKVAKFYGDKHMFHTCRYLSIFRVHSHSKSMTLRSSFTQDTKKIRSKYFKPRHYRFRKLYKYFYLAMAWLRVLTERGIVLTRIGINSR